MVLSSGLHYEHVMILNDASRVVSEWCLAGQNLGWVFNFRYEHVWTTCTSYITTELPNLKWKTRPKQLLGSLPLAFALYHITFKISNHCVWGGGARGWNFIFFEAKILGLYYKTLQIHNLWKWTDFISSSWLLAWINTLTWAKKYTNLLQSPYITNKLVTFGLDKHTNLSKQTH